jgi:signal peptidase
VITGMIADFGISPFAHSPRWLAINFLFAGAPLLAIEASRAAFLRAVGPRTLTVALVATSLGLAAIQFPLRHYQLDGFTANAEFWGSVFIPLVATGLLAGFFVLYGGLRAGLLITAPIVAFTYFSPVLPIAPWPILALVGVAGPATGLWIAESLFSDVVEEEARQANGVFSLPSVAWVLTAVIALAIFWFSFGFFGYRPSFVPSHSMEPLINQGDVVLAGPVEPDQVKVGDIVLYELGNGRQVLHRVVEITKSEDGKRLFITRGDNNNTEDLRPVTDEQIVGRYVGRVPYLGWVPIKFNQWLVEPIR